MWEPGRSYLQLTKKSANSPAAIVTLVLRQQLRATDDMVDWAYYTCCIERSVSGLPAFDFTKGSFLPVVRVKPTDESFFQRKFRYPYIKAL